MYEGQIKPFNVQMRAWYDKFGSNIFPYYYLEGDREGKNTDYTDYTETDYF